MFVTQFETVSLVKKHCRELTNEVLCVFNGQRLVILNFLGKIAVELHGIAKKILEEQLVQSSFIQKYQREKDRKKAITEMFIANKL